VVDHLLQKQLLNRAIVTVLLEDIPAETKMTLVTSQYRLLEMDREKGQRAALSGNTKT